eukprot:CAMPEP_0177757308 /NCGR_PEP_ID=MMETSP0491_2-20121128/3572_1 /TAXON_ID=63592 /ORGANISM="Tetraselmis chuii, Strain PLY429" /LENGTH=368 /DNA_ID=CAMNT_0019272947 /DNA_START=155 /DNA_END=1261 /DNA_ORIENTATION=+
MAEAGGTLYTRGEPGAPDTRGESMVERHQRKIKAEREAGAHAMMKVLLPDAGPALRTLALENCDWDVDRAKALIKRFREVKANELSKVKREVEARKSEAEETTKGEVEKRVENDISNGSESEDQSSSSASDGSGSDSDDERDRKSSRHRRKHSKSKSKSKSRRKERSSKKSRKRKDKDPEDRKAKRHKEKHQPAVAKSAALTGQYGKYGIIRESDYERKRGDFQVWAAEVKKMEVEAMPKWEEKELFKEYCEDYNTGTLAHKKYYDYDAYMRAKAIKEAKKGSKKGGERTTFNDEEERRRQVAQQRADEIEARKKEAYNELRYTTNKAQEMRDQELLRQQMNLAYRTGNMDEARKIKERLNPDEDTNK